MAPDPVLIVDTQTQWNLLRAFPGVPETIADQDFAALFAQSFGLLHAGRMEILRRLTEYRAWCKQRGLSPDVCGFRDFLKQVQVRARSAEEERRDRIVERLDTLIAIYGPLALGANGSFAIERLIQEARLIGYRMTAEAAVCDFLIALLVLRIYRMRENSDDPFNQRPLVLILDEARSILRARDARALDFTPLTETLWARLRAVGMATCAVDQLPSALSPAVAGVSHTRIAFATSGPEFLATVRLLGLTPPQADELQKLERGEFLVRLPAHRWPHVVRARALPPVARP